MPAPWVAFPCHVAHGLGWVPSVGLRPSALRKQHTRKRPAVHWSVHVLGAEVLDLAEILSDGAARSVNRQAAPASNLCSASADRQIRIGTGLLLACRR